MRFAEVWQKIINLSRDCRKVSYVSQIDAFADASFDVVLIDGRARPACICHSVAKVKPGGMLILDNSDRAYYLAQTRPWLQDYTGLTFSGAVPHDPVFAQTTIFFKRS